MQDLSRISVVIPTYGRERVLLETIDALRSLEDPPDEILIVDQTVEHERSTEAGLARRATAGQLRWIRLPRPSIPKAMNTGLREAVSEVVLFVDDDVIPQPGFVRAHRIAHSGQGVVAVAGMVLQPGEEPVETDERRSRGVGLRRDLSFLFRSTTGTEVRNVMAGNLSVKRGGALSCGAFDENFVGVAYRFETEFCRRLWRNGGRVVYEPSAAIRHLRAPLGGTRAWGSHQTSARPEHSVGDYYFGFLEGRGSERWTYALDRLARECLSRFHRRHPWYIVPKAVGEARGLAMALRLAWSRRRDG